MPLYEYQCDTCKKSFAKLVRSMSGGDNVACPKCGSTKTARRLSVFAVNSNSVKTHPQDGPENMKKLATEEKWKFPFLFDESQAVAKTFQAACTPDFYLFDGKKKLVYRGQFDDSRPSNGVPVTGADLKAAIDAVLSNKAPATAQKASIGCNIRGSKGLGQWSVSGWRRVPRPAARIMAFIGGP